MVDRGANRSGLALVLDRLAAFETRHRDRSFETLREELLAGRGDAWPAFVEKYSRFVYTVALRLMTGVTEREEAVGRIYARTLERLQADDHRLIRNFRGDCRFTSYLYRIVQSERKEYFRGEHGRRTESRDMSSQEPRAPTEPDAPVLQPARLREAVRAALNRLERHERTLLLCRFRDGLKLREIADLFGLPDTNAAARALYGAVGRLDLLRELDRRERLGEAERAALERELADQLFRLREDVGDGG